MNELEHHICKPVTPVTVSKFIERLKFSHSRFIDEYDIGIGEHCTSGKLLLVLKEIDKKIDVINMFGVSLVANCELTLDGTIPETYRYSLTIKGESVFNNLCEERVIDYLKGTMIIMNHNIRDLLQDKEEGLIYSYLGI